MIYEASITLILIIENNNNNNNNRAKLQNTFIIEHRHTNP